MTFRSIRIRTELSSDIFIVFGMASSLCRLRSNGFDFTDHGFGKSNTSGFPGMNAPSRTESRPSNTASSRTTALSRGLGLGFVPSPAVAAPTFAIRRSIVRPASRSASAKGRHVSGAWHDGRLPRKTFARDRPPTDARWRRIGACRNAFPTRGLGRQPECFSTNSAAKGCRLEFRFTSMCGPCVRRSSS